MSQPPSFDMPVPSAGNDGGDGGVVDWAEVRSRLERLSVGAAGGLTAADKSRVLKERAELLAQVITPDDDAAATIQVLEFLLGSERYAVDTSSVREVNVLKEITPVPRTPDFILGVISVRGRICSVVDLGRVFGLPPSEPGPEARAIVMASRTHGVRRPGRRGRRHAAHLDGRAADLTADAHGSTPEVLARGDRGARRGARRTAPSHRRRPRRARRAPGRTIGRGMRETDVRQRSITRKIILGYAVQCLLLAVTGAFALYCPARGERPERPGASTGPT